MSRPLNAAEVAALAEGTEVTVTWSGGNGPHRYRVHVAGGLRYAGSIDGDPRMLTYNPLTFVGREPFHTHVWLTAPELAERRS